MSLHLTKLLLRSRVGHMVNNRRYLYTWGKSNIGQLGVPFVIVGTYANPGQRTNKNWLKVAGGYSTATFAIDSDEYMWATGDNQFRQFGNGTSNNTNAFVQVNEYKWDKVAFGFTHALGIQTDGTLWEWGYDLRAFVANGQTQTPPYLASPVQIGSDTWTDVACGFYYNLAIRSDGKLFAWGVGTTFGQFGGPVGGSLGTGDDANYENPTQVGTDNWLTVRAGGGLSQISGGIKSDGTLWGWGSNGVGQVGDGTTTDRLSPVQIGSDTWSSISVGENWKHAIKTDGTLWGWGSNQFGLIGDGTTTNRLSPVQIGSDTWLSVSNQASGRVAAIRYDNQLFQWGTSEVNTLTSSPVRYDSLLWVDAKPFGHHVAAILKP